MEQETNGAFDDALNKYREANEKADETLATAFKARQEARGKAFQDFKDALKAIGEMK